MASSWTGVQIATLAVDALTPLAVVGLGVFVAKASRRIEQVQWANQIVITRRLDIFAQLGPGLNKLLCFATFLGRWKEIQPIHAIAMKRELDEIMYTNRVLFSDQLFDAYHWFMAAIFAMYATVGSDARLRAPIDSTLGDRRNMEWWDDSMTTLFIREDFASLEHIQEAYEKLASQFRTELYITHQGRPLFNADA